MLGESSNLSRPIFDGLTFFAEDVNVIYFADVFEASFNEFACFVGRHGYFGDIVIVLKVDWLRVHERVVDVLVSKYSHDMEDVFGLMVFHGYFKVSEGVESDIFDPRACMQAFNKA